VTEAGAGVSLKASRLTPERLRDAVRRAMAMADQAREVSRRLDPSGAPGRFADAALSLVRPEVAEAADQEGDPVRR
jgi:UDP:flavonoid glycosyltransferase YjiC (YdhE family)